MITIRLSGGYLCSSTTRPAPLPTLRKDMLLVVVAVALLAAPVLVTPQAVRTSTFPDRREHNPPKSDKINLPPRPRKPLIRPCFPAVPQAAASGRDDSQTFGSGSGEPSGGRRSISLESFTGGMRNLAEGTMERVEDVAVGAKDAVAAVVRPVVTKATKVVGIVPKVSDCCLLRRISFQPATVSVCSGFGSIATVATAATASAMR